MKDNNTILSPDTIESLSLDDWEDTGLRLKGDHDRVQFISALEFISKSGNIDGLRIADIGAGPGHQAFAFKNLGAHVVAIDYVKPIYDSIEWASPDSQVSQFDLLWSHHCLEHIPNPLEALIKWNALLKPGGYFCLTVPEFSMTMSSGHLNSYSIPLMMYHLAITGFNTSQKCFTKSRSHLRAYVTKSKKYNPSNTRVTNLNELEKLGLFPPSVSKAIQTSGRFTSEDVFLNWFGTAKNPISNAKTTYDFVLNSMWQ